MILVCPSCESKFNVPDGAIPAEGRKVRCAQCKNSWHATKNNVLKPSPRPAARPVPAAPAPAPVMDAGAAAKAAAIRRAVVEEETPPAPPVEDGLFDEGASLEALKHDEEIASDDSFSDQHDNFSDLDDSDIDDDDDDFESDYLDNDDDGDDILARRRSDLRREAERKSLARKRQLMAGGWILLLVFWLVVLLVPLLMKDTLTRAYPGTNLLYEFFSGVDYAEQFRPAEGETLTPPITETEVYVTAKLHSDRTRVEEVDGKQQLVIRGFVENTGNRAANVPLVEISVKNKNGAVIEQWNYAPQGLVLRRRSKLEFETMLYPIPAGANVVEVRSLEGTRSTNEAESKL